MQFIQQILQRNVEQEEEVLIFVADDLQEDIIQVARRIRRSLNQTKCACLNAKLVDSAPECAICLGEDRGKRVSSTLRTHLSLRLYV